MTRLATESEQMTTAAEKITAAETNPAPGPAAVAPAVQVPAVQVPADKHPDKRKALGRGLDSLLPATPREATPHVPQPGLIAEMHAQAAGAGRESVLQVPLDHIDPNPYQTRVEFDQEALIE